MSEILNSLHCDAGSKIMSMRGEANGFASLNNIGTIPFLEITNNYAIDPNYTIYLNIGMFFIMQGTGQVIFDAYEEESSLTVQFGERFKYAPSVVATLDDNHTPPKFLSVTNIGAESFDVYVRVPGEIGIDPVTFHWIAFGVNNN